MATSAFLTLDYIKVKDILSQAITLCDTLLGHESFFEFVNVNSTDVNDTYAVYMKKTVTTKTIDAFRDEVCRNRLALQPRTTNDSVSLIPGTPMQQSDLLWYFCRATYYQAREARKTGDVSRRTQVVHEGKQAIARALKLCPTSSNVQKYVAIMYNELGGISSMREKLECAAVFQQHVKLALDISPNDPDLHHMLGRFNFEIATIGWTTKQLVYVVFGSLPEASLEASLRHLLLAHEGKPLWALNLAWMARTCHSLGSSYVIDCRRYAEASLAILPKSVEDEEAHQLARTILGKL